jgi:uncharacterized protein YgfB (UPF0149 family)
MASHSGARLSRVTGNEFDYSGLAGLLERSGSPLDLAELHGGLCGVICAGGREMAMHWLDDLLDDCAADADTLNELARQLQGLGASTFTALNGVSLTFVPMLPGDFDAIGERTAGLALWCHGFLAGLVIGGLDLTSGQTDLSPELTELFGDFAEISKAGADAGELEDVDASDESLTELVEFVRVGVQLIFETLAPGSSSSGGRVLH